MMGGERASAGAASRRGALVRYRVLVGAFATTLLTVGLTAAPVSAKQGPPATDPGPTVVASGLLNPRGLAFAPNGTLYVAEAGNGGPTQVSNDPTTECQQYAGTTSRISAINLAGAPGTNTKPVVTGLASEADCTGSSATGADGLSIQGGRILAIMTGNHQSVDSAPPGVLPPSLVAVADAQLGRLIKATPGGQWKSIADVGGFDYNYAQDCINGVPVVPTCDLDPQFPDANPYGVLALPGRTYVADAGANTLDLVLADGSVQILAYVHAQANDFLGDEVPTCVAMAAGQLFVGTLNGNLFRYDGTSTLQQVALTGQHVYGIGGCTGDAAGNLYVSDQAAQFFGQPGGVLKVAPDGSTTLVGVVADPSGIVLGPNGYLYVSQNSTSNGGGQVVRLLP